MYFLFQISYPDFGRYFGLITLNISWLEKIIMISGQDGTSLANTFLPEKMCSGRFNPKEGRTSI